MSSLSKIFLKSYLNFHIMRHKNQMNCICEVCGKGFIKTNQLKNHMRTHTGEKVTCNIRNIKLNKGSLTRHRRLVHSAIEGTLESTFRTKSHRLNRFTKPRAWLGRTKETGPRQYSCKIFRLPFERLKFFKDHNKQMHDDVERTICKICSVTFRYRLNLKAHYREKHKLHVYQIYKLVDHDEDLEVVLAMKPEEIEALAAGAIVIENRSITLKQEEESSTSTSAVAANYFEQDKIHSDALQDEIMKAVEHIDKQEIRIDDEHSMHKFFNDLLKPT